MLPTVSKLTSLDVYRDGGSISATFKDVDDIEFTLFFEIDIAIRGYDSRNFRDCVVTEMQFDWRAWKDNRYANRASGKWTYQVRRYDGRCTKR